MKRNVPPPDPATWDFTSCPQDEVRACLYYEAARESDAVEEYRNSETFEDSPIKSPALGTQYIAFTTPEFPGTPWLRISPEARQERVCQAMLADARWRSDDGLVVPPYDLSEFVEFFSKHVDSICGTNPEESPAPPTPVYHLPGKKVTWVALKLDWSKSKKRLGEEFKDFLKELPHDFASKSTGRCNHRDLLNELGAKRLRDHCLIQHPRNFLKSARAVWKSHGLACPFNTTETMGKAIVRVEKFIEELYRLRKDEEGRDFLSIPVI